MRTPRVTSIDLRNNHIGDPGFAALAQAVLLADTLNSVDLRTNANGALGALSLCDLYRERPNLALHFDVPRVWKAEDPKAGAEAKAMLRTSMVAYELFTNSADDRLLKELQSHRRHHCTRCGCDLNEVGTHWATEIILKSKRFAEPPWNKHPPGLATLDRDMNARDEVLQVFVPVEDESRFCLHPDFCEQPGLPLPRKVNSERIAGSIAEVQLSKGYDAEKVLEAVRSDRVNPFAAKPVASLAEVVIPQGLGDVGTVALAEFLRPNTTITRLILHRHGIGDTGAALLASALGENSTITELYLKGNHISDAGCASLLAPVRTRRIVRLLDLQGNLLRSRGWADLFITFALPGTTAVPAGVEQAFLACTNLLVALLRAVFKFERIPECKFCAAAAPTQDKLRGALNRMRLAASGGAPHTGADASLAAGRRLLIVNTDHEAVVVAEFVRKNPGQATCIRVVNTVGAPGGQALGETLAGSTATGVKLVHCSRRNPPIALQLRQLSLTRKLDLSNAGISDGIGVILARLLLRNDVCDTLDVRNNELTDATGAALAETMAKNATLQSVVLTGNYMGMGTAEALAAVCERKAQHKASVTLFDVALPLGGGSPLTIEMPSMGLTRIDAVVLAGYIRANRTATVLDLSGNPLTDAGALSIAATLADNTTITQVDLSGCGAGLRTAQTLAAAAGAMHGGFRISTGLKVKLRETFVPLRAPEIRNLSFPANVVLDPLEIACLCGFLTHTTELITVDLERSLTPAAVDSLPEPPLVAMVAHNPRLTKINISGTSIPVDDLRGGHASPKTVAVKPGGLGLARVDVILVARLLMLNGGATGLDLSACGLSRNLARLGPALAPAAATGPSLAAISKLVLTQNGLVADDAAALVEILLRNRTVRTLDLRMNRIEDLGAEAMSGLLGQSTTLTQVDLSQNEIRDPGAVALAAGVRANRLGAATLLSLTLIGNKFTDAGQLALEDALHAGAGISKMTMRISLAGPVLSSNLAAVEADKYRFEENQALLGADLAKVKDASIFYNFASLGPKPR